MSQDKNPKSFVYYINYSSNIYIHSKRQVLLLLPFIGGETEVILGINQLARSHDSKESDGDMSLG